MKGERRTNRYTESDASRYVQISFQGLTIAINHRSRQWIGNKAMTTPPLDSVGTLVSRQLDKLSGRKRKVFTRREIKETFGLVNSKMFSQLIWKRKKIELSVECRFSDQKCWIKFSTSPCSNRFRANSIGALAIQGNFRLLL